MVSCTQSTVDAVAAGLESVTVYEAVPPALGSTPLDGAVAALATVTGAVEDTVGSELSAAPPASVCFTWVPLAMYWMGLTAAAVFVGPVARNRYRAVYGRSGPLAPA